MPFESVLAIKWTSAPNKKWLPPPEHHQKLMSLPGVRNPPVDLETTIHYLVGDSRPESLWRVLDGRQVLKLALKTWHPLALSQEDDGYGFSSLVAKEGVCICP